MLHSSQPLSAITEELALWLRGASRIVIMGIGNPLRRDDFVGMAVIKQLAPAALPNVRLIETGEVPENYLDAVVRVRPSHVLLIDAGEFEAPPGSVRLVSPTKVAGLSLSTHALPLSLVSEYLEKRTKATIALLTIQPKVLDFGEGLSEELSRVVKEVSEAIRRAEALSGKRRVRSLRPSRRAGKRSVR